MFPLHQDKISHFILLLYGKQSIVLFLFTSKDSQIENLEQQLAETKGELLASRERTATLEGLRNKYSQEHTQLYSLQTKFEETKSALSNVSAYLKSPAFTMPMLLTKLSPLFELYSLPVFYDLKHRKFQMTTRPIASYLPDRSKLPNSQQTYLLSQIYSKIKSFPINTIK